MKGTLARLGAALVVSSLVLGGCVAETEDGEEAVAQVGTAVTIGPKLPAKPGGSTPNNNAGNASVPVPPGDGSIDPTPDPQPQPWHAGSAAAQNVPGAGAGSWGAPQKP
jgi:hypothetical protein